MSDMQVEITKLVKYNSKRELSEFALFMVLSTAESCVMHYRYLAFVHTRGQSGFRGLAKARNHNQHRVDLSQRNSGLLLTGPSP